MKVIVVGATGFIGAPLCRELVKSGHEVTVLTRKIDFARTRLGDSVVYGQWDSSTDIPGKYIRDAEAIINLAGESIGDGRWTESRKKRIVQSRVRTTEKIVETIESSASVAAEAAAAAASSSDLRQPITLINASAIGYYGPRNDEKLCEDGSCGEDFLATVCSEWEEAAIKAEAAGARVVRIRTGIVLGDGGALKKMLLPFKMFTGGPIGKGSQWMSWIHKDDEVGIILHALNNKEINGPVNATAPHPVTMNRFSKALGAALKRPSWLPIPGFILKLAMGEMSDMVLTGQRVLPCKALATVYEFKFDSLDKALANIIGPSNN